MENTGIIALEKISRNTGEDEYNSIWLLEEERNIRITSKETQFRMNNQIGIFILEPYNSTRFSIIKEKYISNLNLNLFKKCVEISIINEEVYIRHPIFVDYFKIYDDILEYLREEHGFVLDNISELEWEQLHNTPSWKKAEIKVAREFIADKILSNPEI